MELQDIKSMDDVVSQMNSYGVTCEMIADYLQDLRKHIDKISVVGADDCLIAINDAQRALYEASQALNRNNGDMR